MLYGKTEESYVSAVRIDNVRPAIKRIQNHVAVRFFRFTYQHQKRAAFGDTLPESIGKRRLYNDAILCVYKALPKQGKHDSAYKQDKNGNTSRRACLHIECNGQAVRRNLELLGKGRAEKREYSAATGIILINLFFEILNIKTASNRLPEEGYLGFSRRKDAIIYCKQSTKGSQVVV